MLHQRSDGNPFFLEELAWALVEEGALRRRQGQWELQGEAAEHLLPSRLADTIRIRLSSLDPSIGDLLRAAAVVGRSGGTNLLARVTGIAPERAEEMLLAAARTKLVRLEPDGTYAFVHDIVRETLYAEVGQEHRRRLHRAIGVSLADRPGTDSSARSADLAYHFAESEERISAARYAMTAGQEALHMYAAVEAMAHFRVAARLAGDDQPSKRSEALMGLGEAATLAGDYPQAVEAYSDAGEAWQKGGNVAAATKAFHALGRVHRRQESSLGAKNAFERALALAGLTDSRSAAETLLQLADLHVTSLASYPEGIACAERALAMLERLGDKRVEASALCVLGNIRARSNDPTAGKVALERSLKLSEEIDSPALAAEACAYLANVSAWTGDVQRSRELSLYRLRLAERTHDPFEFRHVYAWLGVLETLVGRWSEADAWFAQQERALAGLQTPEPLATLRASEGLLHYFQGQFDLAEREYRETVALLRPTNPGALIWYLGRLALVLAETGARDDAMTCLTELQQMAGPLPEQASARLCAFAYLADGYARLNMRAEAAACYPSLLPFHGQFAPISVDRVLGLAAASAGKMAAARSHLADAEVQTRGAGMSPELALVLLERGRLDSGRQSAEATTEGLRICQELGMQELGRSRAGTAPEAQRGRIAGLTRRELEVLQLVVEGRSNREIAATLFLSEHTIARHLTHIFSKTGVENRAAAAAYALRHNVV